MIPDSKPLSGAVGTGTVGTGAGTVGTGTGTVGTGTVGTGTGTVGTVTVVGTGGETDRAVRRVEGAVRRVERWVEGGTRGERRIGDGGVTWMVLVGGVDGECGTHSKSGPISSRSETVFFFAFFEDTDFGFLAWVTATDLTFHCRVSGNIGFEQGHFTVLRYSSPIPRGRDSGSYSPGTK